LSDEPTSEDATVELIASLTEMPMVLDDSAEARAESEGALRRALRLLEGLGPARPTSTDRREIRAGIHHRLYHLLSVDGRREEATAEARLTLADRQSLIKDLPTRPGLRFQLAEAYLDFAGERIAYRPSMSNTGQASPPDSAHSGRLMDSTDAYHAALDILRGLVAEFPRDENYRYYQARANTSYGLALQGLGKLDEAVAAHREACKTSEALVTKFPSIPKYRSLLGGSLTNLGLALEELGQRDEAERVHIQAIEIKEKLVAEHPENSNDESELGASLNNRAMAIIKKNPAAAVRLLQKALAHQRAALAVEPENPTYRGFLRNHWGALGDALLKLGNHREAARASAELVRVSPHPAQDCFFAASHLAQCVPMAESDSSLSTDDQARLARSYAAQCFELAARSGEWTPDDAFDINPVAWLLVIGASPQLYDPARALRLAEKATKLAPHEPNYWFVLGVARYRLGDIEGALAAVERARHDRSEPSPNDYLLLAMAVYRQGQAAEARTMYEQIVEALKRTHPLSAETKRFCAEAGVLMGLAELPDDVFARPSLPAW
jgi:tetratricopeptide (TPR) repeat protein